MLLISYFLLQKTIYVIANGFLGFKKNLNSEMRTRFINSCLNRNFLSLWLTKKRAANSEHLEFRLKCLLACTSENCNGSTFTQNSYLIYETSTPQDVKSSSLEQMMRFKSIYETKDSTVKRLNYIAETISELKVHLITQQQENIIPIRQKIINLTTILDIMKMFVNGSHNRTNTLIGKIIRMRNSMENSINKIVLNMPKELDNKVASLLLQRLKIFNSKLKKNAKNEHKLSKRSTIYAGEWNGISLHTTNLILLEKCSDNFNEKHILKNISTSQISGNIILDTLYVRSVDKTNTELFGMKKRLEKRATALTSLRHQIIVVKSINDFPFEQFLRSIYRRGVNVAINGLYQFSI